MIQSLLERASLLIEHQRFDEAQNKLNEILSSDPMNVDAITLMAVCKSELKEHKESIALIQQSIRQQPDNDYFLYLHSLFSFRNEDIKEAKKFIASAITYNPREASYFGLLATINLSERDWQLGLENADRGLEIDPDNLTCLNTRSTALFKLDKKDEAYSTIAEALQQDPHNDSTHTNVGWGLLEKGDHAKALEHFREALKINPNNQVAKAGLVEGLKARYLFYRIFLKYCFWIGNLKGKLQWVVIIGFYAGSRLLRVVSEKYEALEPLITPIIILYTLFALSTWIVTPLSNLFLRLNVYGRYALSEQEIKSSNFVGISLCVGIVGVVMYFVNPIQANAMIGFFGITMMIPLSSMFNPAKEQSKKILMAYALALTFVGAISITLETLNLSTGIFPMLYLFGIIAYGWVANAFVIR